MCHSFNTHVPSPYESGLQIQACFISELVTRMNTDIDMKQHRDFKALNNLIYMVYIIYIWAMPILIKLHHNNITVMY